MNPETTKGRWAPAVGWTLVLLAFAVFVWGMHRRSTLELRGRSVVRMLFVPSVEQGTLVERAGDLARFIREDSGLTLQTKVPTSYAAVIQALGSGQADVAWMPAFAYVIAHGRYGAEARLQVVRSTDRFGIVATRSGPGEPATLAQLAGRSIAFPGSLSEGLRRELVATLDREAPGWVEVPVDDDRAAAVLLAERLQDVSAAVNGHVDSGPYDFVGNGLKELEYDRPGTLISTRIVFRTAEPIPEDATFYHGCIMTRADSGVRRLEDLQGMRFAFSDETSTSGHIFPRMLLDRNDVSLGRVYFAGGHSNTVQAVWDGKADAGAGFYSPPGKEQREADWLVGDARYLILKRMPDLESREQFLEKVRVLMLTDPIPNDVSVVRKDFPEDIWKRFAASFARFLDTQEGREVYFDLLSAIDAAPTTDATFDGFRAALAAAGVRAEGLLEAAEEKLERQRQSAGGGV